MKGTYIIITFKDGTTKTIYTGKNKIKEADELTKKFNGQNELIEWINREMLINNPKIDPNRVKCVTIGQKKHDSYDFDGKISPVMYAYDKMDISKIKELVLNYILVSPNERIKIFGIHFVQTDAMLNYRDGYKNLETQDVIRAVEAYFAPSKNGTIPYKKYRDSYFKLVELGIIKYDNPNTSKLPSIDTNDEMYNYEDRFLDGDMLDLASCQGHQIGFDEYAEYLEGKVSNRPTNPYTRRRIKD